MRKFFKNKISTIFFHKNQKSGSFHPFFVVHNVVLKRSRKVADEVFNFKKKFRVGIKVGV